MTMTTSRTNMMPKGQWRTLNVLRRPGRAMAPWAFYEPDLASLHDAELIIFRTPEQEIRVRRQGDGFKLPGGDWPPEAWVAITGRGLSWLRDNPYQQALTALRGLNARPGRAVGLVAAMNEAGLTQRDLYAHLARERLIRGSWSHTGNEINQPEVLEREAMPSLLQVALTREGLSIMALVQDDD